jgi:hypothetical protein
MPVYRLFEMNAVPVCVIEIQILSIIIFNFFGLKKKISLLVGGGFCFTQWRQPPLPHQVPVPGGKTLPRIKMGPDLSRTSCIFSTSQIQKNEIVHVYTGIDKWCSYTNPLDRCPLESFRAIPLVDTHAVKIQCIMRTDSN